MSTNVKQNMKIFENEMETSFFLYKDMGKLFDQLHSHHKTQMSPIVSSFLPLDLFVSDQKKQDMSSILKGGGELGLYFINNLEDSPTIISHI